MQINYIFEIENTLTPWLRKFGSITHDNIPKLNLDERQRIMLRNECDELKNTIKVIELLNHFNGYSIQHVIYCSQKTVS